MWDIRVCCGNHYLDIFKAYFIVNNISYEERNGIVFFVDTVDKLFNIVKGLDDFYHDHKKQGMYSIDFVINVDEDGTYCITPARFAEY